MLLPDTQSAPAPAFSVIEHRLAAQFGKQCKTCGAVHARGDWKGLKLKGQHTDAFCTMELRDCGCGSTLAVMTEIHDVNEE